LTALGSWSRSWPLRPAANQLSKKEKHMATEKQTAANRENAQHSTGPTSDAGLDASSRINAWRHGLAVKDNERFGFLIDENSDKFDELLARLKQEHNATTETDVILVRHMAQSEWLRARALRLQTDLLREDGKNVDPAKLAIFIRYQTTHERAFHRSLKELQNLRKERRNLEIGFESQKLKQAAEVRASEGMNLKKEAQNLKREEFEFKKTIIESRKEVKKVVKSDPGDLKMAA
jgi:hypothetical protein